MGKKIEKKVTDDLKRIGNTIDDLCDKLEIQRELERREIYKRAATNLLLFRLNTSGYSYTECMDWAIEQAKTFSEKVMEHASDKVKPVGMSDEEIIREFHDRKLIDAALTDDDVVKEVYDRGLVADVLFTNEDLVETYGWVRKSETEF